MDIKRRGGTIIAAGIAIIILVLSIMPADLTRDQPAFYFPGIDKLVHGIMYMVFTSVVLIEYYRVHTIRAWSLILILTSILAYSALIEIIQFFLVTTRSGEVLDVFANLAGILAGLILLLILRKFRS